MFTHRSATLIAIVGLAASTMLYSQPVAAGSSTPSSDKYIVVLRDDTADVPALAHEHTLRLGVDVNHVYEHALKGYAATIAPERLKEIQNDPRVAFVSEDQPVQADGLALFRGGESAPTGMRRIGALVSRCLLPPHSTICFTEVHQASNVNVAVIDTGIDLSHPDLNAVNGINCVSPGALANDDNGHGSHVSGTIAARNNGSGVVGVAPGTKLYAVKVLNAAGSGSFSQIICGIDWVTSHAAALNIKVANMSLGGSGSSDNNCGNTNHDALHRAICNSTAAGITYVVAAGNSGANFANQVPAAYPQVLTVTAMSDSDGQPGGHGGAPTCRPSESDDAFATFSNFALPSSTNIRHTIAGPGVCINSTFKNGGYATLSGTSMAAPHVTGAVALCIGNGGATGPCAGLSPSQIVLKLISDAQAHATASNGFTGDPSHPVTGKWFGYLVSVNNY